jgi:predicted lipoprotein with Yx(FWY)xxD motif
MQPGNSGIVAAVAGLRAGPLRPMAVAARRSGLLAAAAVIAGAVIAVAVAACGGRATPGPPRYEVLTRGIPGLGQIITDGQGFTLYMYRPDNRGPSQCSGFCAQHWPPLILPPAVTRPKAGPGVRASLLGTVRRANGQLQETYGGWPLYLWIGDTSPGQATGQADDMGLWYVLSVTGSVDEGTPR